MSNATVLLETPEPSASKQTEIFRERERRLLEALAEVAIPRGTFIRGGDEETARRTEQYFAEAGKGATAGYRGMLHSLDLLALGRYGRSFARLPLATRDAFLRRLEELPGGLAKQLVRLVLTPIKIAHLRDPEIFAHFGIPFESPPPVLPVPRYFSQVQNGEELTEDEEIEADVVIVGSGAGGAVVAKELAGQGFATVILEEGHYFTRQDFRSDTTRMINRLYRDRGLTASLGSPVIPIPLGMTVGGSTTVNSGTCLRARPALFRRWREEDGLREFEDDHLTPYYERVEQFLGVGPNASRYVGKIGEVIARGCEALGIKHHGPLPRNAPDCDGQGLCCFGCPTDAKKSANVSWIPTALKSGAVLYTRVRAQKVLQENGKAVGVVARALRPGKKVSLTVRARAVVLCGGTMMTPLLLEQSGLGRGSGALGKNLTIHPAVSVAALFDEEINGWNTVPQGYEISEFMDEGLLFEGAFGRPDLVALNFPSFGEDFTRLMESYQHLVIFGFMISDSARGRVRRSPRNGKPLVTYQINAVDAERFKRGIEILGRIYFAAGAKEIILPLCGKASLTDERDLVAFRSKNIPLWAFDITAFHPLGTCRMGPDPRTSVVSPNHELHDLANCYVVDGSTVNGPLGVNPQLTIMAMALRAAERIAARLS